jgi:hypothetical protein
LKPAANAIVEMLSAVRRRRTAANITGGGACHKLANTYGVPQTFDLTFEHGRTRRACRVVWRTDTKLGVTFEPQAPPAKGSTGR